MKANNSSQRFSGNSNGRPKKRPAAQAHPLVVAIAAPAATAMRVAAQLMGRLIRRGFRVEVMKMPQQPVSPESDIVLVPFRSRQVERLADEITEEWTQQWLTWYASQKRQNRK